MNTHPRRRTPLSRGLCLVLGWMLLPATSLHGLAAAQETPMDGPWKFTLEQPRDGWQQPSFDAADWQQGSGGFGTAGTPAARIGTPWRTADIWLRKQFTLESIPARPALLMHHDEDVVVYLNGTLVTRQEGYVTEYQVIPIGADRRDALRVGENVMAVHCRQTGGGQFIDVHLVDAENVPTLPAAERPDRPFQSELLTTWGAELSPENAWQEYPRPAMKRDQWVNLNGLWDYAITSLDAEPPAQWDGQILVPFALESKLSGVQKLLDPDEALWYRTTVSLDPPDGQRTLLHFEAVDYSCEAWLDGQSVGSHVGGNTPFTLDITDAIAPGEQTLVLRVEDVTEGTQLNGKQSLNPQGIWYTQVSGIWQTVWAEFVPQRSITELDIETDAAAGRVAVRPSMRGTLAPGDRWIIHVIDDQTPVATIEGEAKEDVWLETNLDSPRLWSPDSPHLYGLIIRLVDSQGDPVDRVDSYAGIRSVGTEVDSNGHRRFTLNGEVIFHWGPLDQGWWPDGLLTPPSETAMKSDIEFLKEAGFNMIRKHIKVEPRRYYYDCDVMGMMVWQDQVSGGNRPPWTRLRPNPEDARWEDADHEQFMAEFEAMVDDLEIHPSIVVWTPFNEAWGQHRTVEVGRWIAERDPTRLVNIASGGNFWPVGDVVDHHSYPHPDFPFDPARFEPFVRVVGEFGGHGLPIEGHLWDASRDNWGYGGLPKNADEYRDRYVESLRRLRELKARGIAAGVYTQTTDVEGEINGLMTYDRKQIKLPAKELKQLHQSMLFEEEAH